jgi:hypothetical protein
MWAVELSTINCIYTVGRRSPNSYRGEGGWSNLDCGRLLRLPNREVSKHSCKSCEYYEWENEVT